MLPDVSHPIPTLKIRVLLYKIMYKHMGAYDPDLKSLHSTEFTQT